MIVSGAFNQKEDFSTGDIHTANGCYLQVCANIRRGTGDGFDPLNVIKEREIRCPIDIELVRQGIPVQCVLMLKQLFES